MVFRAIGTLIQAICALMLLLLKMVGLASPAYGQTEALTTNDITQAFSVAHRAVFEGSRKVVNHSVVLSGIKKVNGDWRAENSQIFSGVVFRQTLEFQPQRLESIEQALRSHVASLELAQVFHCEGLACGSSHGWANAIFDNRLLYGKDAKQRYWAWRPPGADNLEPWYIAYLVERGNQRIYLEWQVSKPHPDAVQQAKNLASRWQNQGYAALPNEQTLVDAVTLSAVGYWLDELNSREIAVVGHNRDASQFANSQQVFSLRAAETMARFLESRFAQVTWKPYGLGGLAPRASVAEQKHVELVPLSNPTSPAVENF